MKKIALLLVVLLLAGTFAFAGGGGQASSGFRADVFWYTFADTYLASVRNAMDEQASGTAVNLTHHDCQENQALQTQMVQTAITQGTRLLIVNIVTTAAEDAAMNIANMARTANIPIIFFNREVSDAVIRSYANAAFVGTDANEAGYLQGEAIANFLLRPANWTGNRSNFDLNGDGIIRYVMLRGEHGNAEAFGRTLYSVQEANDRLSGRLRLQPSAANETSTQYPNDGVSNFFLMANWSAATAANLMRTALTAHSLTNGAIELIIANNDDAAIGAIEALRERGYNTGSGNFIPTFGVDATAVAQENIRAGRMTATVMQDAVGMARVVLELAQNIAGGRALMAGTASYNIDAGVNKIRVPYAIFE